MNILVTGATGFIGNALVQKLLKQKQKNKIRMLVRNPKFQIDGVEVVLGDVTNPESCRKACDGIYTIFHCAGVLGGWGIANQKFWDVNVTGTKNMLDVAVETGVKKFVHVSSCGIFGPLKDGKIADEKSDYNPTNIYEKTKIEGEKLVLLYAKKLCVVIVRPEFVYGPGDKHLLSLFKAVNEKRFVFFNNGKSTVHPTYIEDAVDGMLLAASNPKACGHSFNIAGPEPVSVKKFIGTMSDALGVKPPSLSIPTPIPKITGIFLDHTIGLFAKPPLTLSQVRYLTENRAFSFEKARKVLNYRPKTTLKDGMRKTVKWYREQKLI